MDRFQSTLPIKGETPRQAEDLAVVTISIHSPNKGRDRSVNSSRLTKAKFQSTLPIKGETRNGVLLKPTPARFQSTLPIKGETDVQDFVDLDDLFQSTLPIKGETKVLCWLWLVLLFQSTLPIKGETLWIVDSTGGPEPFQSTLPIKGETRRVSRHLLYRIDFNPLSQ